MGDRELGGESDLSVADVAEQRWGVRPSAAIERFDLPGWSYEGEVDVVCPRCHGVLHTMRKPYESEGKTYRYVAIVCPVCPASFTLPDLGLKTQADLLARGSRQARSATSPSANAGTQRGDTSVRGIAEERWGVRPAPAVARFALPGWEYLRETDVACPQCAGLLHGLSRVYEQQGRPRVQAALVCPVCPATFTTRQLNVPRASIVGEVRANLLAASAPADTDQAREGQWPGDNGRTPRGRRTDRAASLGRPGSDRVTELPGLACSPSPGLRIRAVRANDMASLLGGTARGRSRSQDIGPLRTHLVKPPVETRRLYWRKIATPTTVLPSLPPGTDVRVLLPSTQAFDELRERLAVDGVAFRSVSHWVEEENISTVDQDDELRPLSVTVALTSLGELHTEWGLREVDQPAYDARDAFEAIWDAHDQVELADEPPHVPAGEVVPREWLGFLPFDRLNPAQAQAAPAVLETIG